MKTYEDTAKDFLLPFDVNPTEEALMIKQMAKLFRGLEIEILKSLNPGRFNIIYSNPPMTETEELRSKLLHIEDHIDSRINQLESEIK